MGVPPRLETGAEPAEVARAYWIARHVTKAEERWADVEALDGKLDPELQNVLMVGVDTLVEDVARWYLLNAPGRAPRRDDRGGGAGLRRALGRPRGGRPGGLAGSARGDRLVSHRRRVSPSSWQAACLPARARSRPGRHRGLAGHRPPDREVAGAFFLAGERFHLDWLERHLVELPDGSRFERWASQAVGDDLMTLRREIALRVLDSADGRPLAQAMDDYLDGRSEAYERLNRLVSSLQAQGETSLAALTVALRQVRGLVSLGVGVGLRAEVVAEAAGRRATAPVNRCGRSPASSAASLRRMASLTARAPSERIGSGEALRLEADDRQARELVLDAEREAGEDGAGQLAGPDAVARVAGGAEDVSGRQAQDEGQVGAGDVDRASPRRPRAARPRRTGNRARNCRATSATRRASHSNRSPIPRARPGCMPPVPNAMRAVGRGAQVVDRARWFQTASPAVQPISASRSGAGAVRTM